MLAAERALQQKERNRKSSSLAGLRGSENRGKWATIGV